ncbi:hypothetical protein AVEN_164551-1 [Araneus ventricosus]|uniref:Uncharacterized protein n=1 Tax=Araneus ventricosus TaxID=182803 RepID=A0A4Y2B225_ARAVE|nr:hypothetical protein AVEN_164551-1 [Araneus ventricosus]
MYICVQLYINPSERNTTSSPTEVAFLSDGSCIPLRRKLHPSPTEVVFLSDGSCIPLCVHVHAIRGFLVLRSRLCGRGAPGSKLESIKEPPCKRDCCTLNLSGKNVLPLVWCGSLKWGCGLRCCPCHLATVQNYDVRSKTSLVLYKYN